MPEIQHTNNPALQTILHGWQGNPLINGRFIDPHKPFSGSFKKVLKWQLSKKEKKEEKKNDKWRLSVHSGNDFLKQKEDCMVWLGHASFFFQLNGVRFITDPVFDRISGVVPRFSKLPCAVADITGIDYVLLSHGHRDHCDKISLRKIVANNPQAKLLTSLNVGKLVAGWIEGLHFQEAGWYQQYNLPQQNLKITFLPTQHWSNRYLWDLNKTLWGSFMIEADGLNIFFGGDSGYSSYTKQIGELFPDIDIAMIGVGAYTPPFMMRDVHTNPYEAVDAFHDLKAKTFIPMHYGTFDLADEPLGEPYRILKQLEAEKKINGSLRMLEVGEVMAL
jgi:L-ascorbate metabolism protein UlaG (beta-lactamase superfamily)